MVILTSTPQLNHRVRTQMATNQAMSLLPQMRPQIAITKPKASRLQSETSDLKQFQSQRGHQVAEKMPKIPRTLTGPEGTFKQIVISYQRPPAIPIMRSVRPLMLSKQWNTTHDSRRQKNFFCHDELAKLGPTQLKQLSPCKYIEKKNHSVTLETTSKRQKA